MEAFERLAAHLLDATPAVELTRALKIPPEAAALNAAFLITLCGARHPAAERAATILRSPPSSAATTELAQFYRTALDAVRSELSTLMAQPELRARLDEALTRVADAGDDQALAEGAWRLFFPEGVGILGHEDQRVAELRTRRTVQLTELNPHPITDVAREVLLTSNVLLTIPAATTDIDRLPYPTDFRRELAAAASEPQLRWYDHPIQIGVEPAANELLYGLRGLDEAAAFESGRGNLSRPLRVVLSVSVTHQGLRTVAPDYVRHELERAGGFDNLEVYVFTELDTVRLIDEVLLPAGGGAAADGLRAVFGVDGEYGRHYSFLKAIAALWNVLVEPDVRATFKIDLDQVFAQEVLVDETGMSAFEHLLSPLWGARGTDSWGDQVELGMIAGALVNERDIGRGLFTPDVDYPAGPSALDEYVFLSRLPQALSTRAEMMTRYGEAPLDGRQTCLERVHVTGGTNGILVDALRRHRPFTPTFFGRAEDQAYVMPVLGGGAGGSAAPEPRLTYAHAAGLIMRHDKEAFAAAAIEAARAGKLVGDDVRILYFSAFAELLGRERIKALADPFTGCFISNLPRTVVLLRFALRLAHASERGDERLVNELATMGVTRVARALDFTAYGGPLADELAVERRGWDTYYDALDELEDGLVRGGSRAERQREVARAVVAGARVSPR